MATYYLIQQDSLSLLFEIILFLFTLTLAIVANKVFRITKEKNVRMFALGFFLIALANGALALGGITLFLQQTFLVREMFFLIIQYTYLASKTLGLFTLACIPLKLYDTKIYGLVAAIILICTTSAIEDLYLFQIIILLFYAVVVASYIQVYLRKKNRMTVLIGLGFTLLAIGSVIFAVMKMNHTLYVIGHLVEVAGLALILIALLVTYVFAHEKRKITDYS